MPPQRLFAPSFSLSAVPLFVLNQCPSTYRSLRASEAGEQLIRLGVLAEPMLPASIDFQDAIAAGLGVTEYARGGKAAQEIEALWHWIGARLMPG